MGKLTIVGAGVAGSYLANRLEQKGFDFSIYEKDPKRRGHRCAWGSFVSFLDEKLEKTGLNVDDYILCKTDTLCLNGVDIKLRNEASIDKPRMLRDIYPNEKIVEKEFIFGSADHNGWIVNATASPLSNHFGIPTLQYKAKIENLEPRTAYVNIDFRYAGYGWIFPLTEDSNLFHLGAGCVNGNPETLISMVTKKYGAKVTRLTCKCSRSIAVVEPKSAIIRRKNVISVGEAAGCVYPISGEGIVPSIDSADLFLESLFEDTFPQSYLMEMRTVLHDYEKAFSIWKLMNRHQRLAWLKGVPSLFARAKERTMAELDLKTKISLLLKLVLPQAY